MRHLSPLALLLPAALLAPATLHASLDLDHDGMSDVWAAAYPAANDPAGDTDGDGASNLLESQAGTDPLNPQSRPFTTLAPDAGGNLVLRWPASRHKNYVIESSSNLTAWGDDTSPTLGVDGEISRTVGGAVPLLGPFFRLRFLEKDQDSDGLSNAEELLLGSRPDQKDSDGDGLPDYWETIYGANPLVADAGSDLDHDGFSNLQEYRAGTDWSVAEPILAGGPRIFWASQPVKPDETILATCGGTDIGTTAELARLADGAPGLPPAPEFDPATWNWTAVAPHTATPRNVTVTVPSDWTQGIYALRVTRGGQASPARLVNLPDPWFVQGDQGDTATPGGSFVIAGNCLAFSGATPRAVLLRAGHPAVELTAPSRVGTQAPKTGSAPSVGFALRYTVPAGTPAGDYSLYLHNGYGGPAGWVKFTTAIETPITTVTVRAAEPWPATTYNLTAMAGANDDERFAAAFALVKANGGGRVHIPAGTYTLTQRLILPRRTVLVGDGPGKSIVSWSANPPINDPAYDDSGWGVNGIVHGEKTSPGNTTLSFTVTFALENLTLRSSPTFLGKLVMRNGVTEPGWFRNTHLEIATPSLSEGRPMALYLQDAANTIIEDCVISSPNHCIYTLRGVTYIRISGSTFRFRGMNISFSGGGHNHVIYDNVFEMCGNPDENGWNLPKNNVPNPGFFFACFNSQPYCRDLLLANNWSENKLEKFIAAENRTEKYSVREYVGYSTDGTSGGYTGPIASAAGTTLVVPGTITHYSAVNRAPNWEGSVVQILGGRGAGQWRLVVSAPSKGSTITVDRPWDIEPDATSTIGLNEFLGRTIFIDNNYAAEPLHQDYYCTLDSIKASNAYGVVKVPGAPSGDPTPKAAVPCWTGRHYYGTMPGWHLQVLDNTVVRGESTHFLSGVMAPTVGYSGEVGAAHVYRNNINLTAKPFTLKLTSEGGRFSGALLEHNQVDSIALEGRFKPKQWADHPYAVSGVLLRQNTLPGSTSAPPINPGSTGTSAKPTGTIPGTVVLP